MALFGKKTEEADINFTCKIGRMGKEGWIIWVPKRFHHIFERGTYIEVKLRKLK